ncbi:hypothetical protein LTR53_006197 [Teratosphaeriaceae sp. CCFEE 6253]|nr:hypothetical protein LTR53_006197 [Teratosphaeriaceae sp. CCFEE 6253]
MKTETDGDSKGDGLLGALPRPSKDPPASPATITRLYDIVKYYQGLWRGREAYEEYFVAAANFLELGLRSRISVGLGVLEQALAPFKDGEAKRVEDFVTAIRVLEEYGLDTDDGQIAALKSKQDSLQTLVARCSRDLSTLQLLQQAARADRKRRPKQEADEQDADVHGDDETTSVGVQRPLHQAKRIKSTAAAPAGHDDTIRPASVSSSASAGAGLDPSKPSEDATALAERRAAHIARLEQDLGDAAAACLQLETQLDTVGHEHGEEVEQVTEEYKDAMRKVDTRSAQLQTNTRSNAGCTRCSRTAPKTDAEVDSGFSIASDPVDIRRDDEAPPGMKAVLARHAQQKYRARGEQRDEGVDLPSAAVNDAAGSPPAEQPDDFTNFDDPDDFDDGETPLTLQPAFPFQALVDRRGDGTLQTLQFDALSDDLATAVNDLKPGWEAKALRTMKKAWPAVFGLLLCTVNQCAQMKIDNGGLSRWTHLDPKFLACKTCANMARLCFKQHGHKLYLLPLPEAVRESTDPTAIGYYKLSEPFTISRGANKAHKGLWPSEDAVE